MQEETMAMSDDEISDEVVMVDPSQTSPYNQRQLELQKRDQTVIDNQLKAVGLYEEGLSAEQKEELLAVIAASEETAQQEESMRTKAREWQQKVFPSEMDIHTPSASSVCQSILQPAYVNVVSESEVQNSLQMLNIEGSVEPSVPSEIFQSPEKVLTRKAPETSQEFQGCISGDNLNAVQRMQKQVSRRGRPRRLRTNCETNDTKTIQGSLVFHSPEDEEELVNIEEVDFQKQRKDLEKYFSEWQPSNSSPDPPLLPHKRIQQKDDMVPYKCVTEQCGQSLLSSANKFHSAVTELQRSSPYFLQWGCPITVGRAYATRSTRARGPDSENSDGVYNFHFPNISDQTPALSTSKNDPYLRLRELVNKKRQSGLNVDSTSVGRTKSSNPIINQVSPNSLNATDSKSTKASACETVKQPETQSDDVLKSVKTHESTATTSSTESSVSNLTKSESIHLCKIVPSDNCDDCFSNTVSKTLLCKQRKSLSETDVSATTNGPILNCVGETNSDEVNENRGSPLIIVDDDDPFEEQENVACIPEKGARRKRVSAKVPVASPSKRYNFS